MPILVLSALGGGKWPSLVPAVLVPDSWSPPSLLSLIPVGESSLETAQTQLPQSHRASSPEVRKELGEGIKPWQAGYCSG